MLKPHEKRSEDDISTLVPLIRNISFFKEQSITDAADYHQIA